MSNFKIHTRSTSDQQFDQVFAKIPSLLREQKYLTTSYSVETLTFLLEYAKILLSEFWYITDNGKVVASIGANFSSNNDAYIGFFELDLNHPKRNEITKLILNIAFDWLRDNGAKKVIGPVNLNTWFPYRFNTTENQKYSFDWEPSNPKEYPALFKEFGFEQLETYTSICFTGLDSLISSYENLVNSIEDQGFYTKIYYVDRSKEDLLSVEQLNPELKVLLDKNFSANPFLSLLIVHFSKLQLNIKRIRTMRK